MSVIENFSTISKQEQLSFAEALVKTINSESTFTADTNFKVVDVEGDDTTGDLYITLETEDLIPVSCEATWQCGDEEEAYDTPDSYAVNYADSIFNDAAKAFKTLNAEIDGYDMELMIDDVDAEETDEVIVDRISNEDSGIGHYEYFGATGYDSNPYVEVEGTLVQLCSVALTLAVGAAAPKASEEPAEQLD